MEWYESRYCVRTLASSSRAWIIVIMTPPGLWQAEPLPACRHTARDDTEMSPTRMLVLNGYCVFRNNDALRIQIRIPFYKILCVA